MPEHFRALIVVLAAAIPVFWLAQSPICNARITTEDEYKRDRNVWLGATFIVFLSHNFWLYSAGMALLGWRASQRHPNPLALYCLLLFVAPPFQLQIPGVGPIDHIIAIDHYRILNLSILAPFALELRKSTSERGPRTRAVDVFVFGLLLWMAIVQVINDSITGTVRAWFYLVVDIALPYYVASRALRTSQDFSRVASSLVLAGSIVGLLSCFEWARFWLVYESLRSPLGMPAGLPMYLLRGDGGPLRANVSLGNAIVLGYVLAMTLAMLLALYKRLEPRWKAKVALAAIVAGLIGSVSRGPWLGAAFALLVFIVTGPGVGKRVAMLIFGGGAAIGALLLSPFGDTIISYLPFVGSVETGSVDYRSRLFDVSMQVFWQSPWVGDFYYLRNPIMEQMRQGQGIIDMVNTYLQIAMPYGFIGLFLFAGAFATGLLQVWKTRRLVSAPEDAAVETFGRALFAGLLGALLTIGTVSSIGVIPTMYWLLLGCCVSYRRAFGLRAPQRQAVRSTPAASRREPLRPTARGFPAGQQPRR